jgi:hypothetical protein
VTAAELGGTSLRPQFADVSDVWPAIRARIADEKIAAEGKSIFRRGVLEVGEMRFENAPIPSGDANDLVMLTGICGIEPDDALGHRNAVLHNWQGRYWYDVRLRASDVLREFPPLTKHSSSAATEAAKSQPGAKGNRPRGKTSRYPWDRCKEAVFEKLRQEGEPSPDDPGWASQADVERFVVVWMEEQGHEPVESIIRKHTSTWLAEFKAAKSTGELQA